MFHFRLNNFKEMESSTIKLKATNKIENEYEIKFNKVSKKIHTIIPFLRQLLQYFKDIYQSFSNQYKYLLQDIHTDPLFPILSELLIDAEKANIFEKINGDELFNPKIQLIDIQHIQLLQRVFTEKSIFYGHYLFIELIYKIESELYKILRHHFDISCKLRIVLINEFELFYMQFIYVLKKLIQKVVKHELLGF